MNRDTVLQNFNKLYKLVKEFENLENYNYLSIEYDRLLDEIDYIIDNEDEEDELYFDKINNKIIELIDTIETIRR